MYSKAESHKHGEKLLCERSVVLIKKPNTIPVWPGPEPSSIDTLVFGHGFRTFAGDRRKRIMNVT